MLPKTSVIDAPSMRMRVGSRIDRMASTAAPSLASTSCSALAGRAVMAAIQATASTAPIVHPRQGVDWGARRDMACLVSVADIGYLLETFQMHARTGVAELDPIGLEVVGRLEAVDQGAQAPADDDALAFFAGHQLLGCEDGGGFDPFQAFGLPFLPCLERAVLLGFDVAEQNFLLPVDRGRRYVED